MGGPDFQHVAAHTERTALERLIIPAVLLGNQIGHDLALVIIFARLQVLRHRAVGFDRTDAVNARHRGHDDHIVAFQKRTRGRVAHPVNLFVDLAFFFYVGVRAGDIGLWLVVVVIADEIFDRIVGEEVLELTIKLGGQRFIRGQYDGRALGFLDDLGHRECLARARGPQKDLVLITVS